MDRSWNDPGLGLRALHCMCFAGGRDAICKNSYRLCEER